jgi:hypothetical protein
MWLLVVQVLSQGNVCSLTLQLKFVRFVDLIDTFLAYLGWQAISSINLKTCWATEAG